MSLSQKGKKEFYGFVRGEASAISGQLDLSDDAVERLKSRGAAFRQGLLALVRRYSAVGLIEDTACEILRYNFFGSTECEEHFGVKLEEVPEIPFSADDLQAVKDTHILVLVPALSIDEIWKRHTSLFYTKKSPWYANEKFATEKPDKAEWHLVRKHPVQRSTSKTWEEQQALLSQGDLVPTARVMVYTIIAHFLSTGERLFENVYVRCSDLHSGGYRVRAGHFLADGLSFSDLCDDDCRDYVGLASARRKSN